MKCLECGTKMGTERESYLYDAQGIRVTLHGVPVHRCTKCGEYEVEIPRMEALHQILVGLLLRKPERLVAAEIRFLRKYLGWSGADFSRKMGVTPETVSRWENGKGDMGTSAERLLRLMVHTEKPIDDYTTETLAGVAVEGPKPLRVALRSSSSGWVPAAA